MHKKYAYNKCCLLKSNPRLKLHLNSYKVTPLGSKECIFTFKTLLLLHAFHDVLFFFWSDKLVSKFRVKNMHINSTWKFTILKFIWYDFALPSVKNLCWIHVVWIGRGNNSCGAHVISREEHWFMSADVL